MLPGCSYDQISVRNSVQNYMDVPVTGRGTFNIADPAELLSSFLVFLLAEQVKLFEILLCLLHVRRTFFFRICECEEVIIHFEIHPKSVTCFPFPGPLVDLLHFLRCGFLLFGSLLSRCSIPSVQIFLSLYYVSQIICHSSDSHSVSS